MKLFAKNLSFFMLSAVQNQATAFTLTIAFIAGALTFTARADERMSQVQTVLGSTTLSGFVQSGFTFYPLRNASSTQNRILWGQPHFEFPRFQNTESPSLTPLPPPSLEENTLFQSSSFVLALVDTPVQPIMMPLPSDSFPAGATMLEAIRMDEATGVLQFPIAPPPDFQIQLNQAGIQPVPEPSAFALGGMAFGLIVFRRLKLNSQVARANEL
jgi:hypothetical protein